MAAQNINPLYFSVVAFFIVFATLFVLVVIISLIKRLDKSWEDREAAHKERALIMPQNIDNTTLVLISAAIGAYFQGRARIKRVRVLPRTAKQGGSWAFQARTTLQGSHNTKR